jgi:hypothetical protein
LGKEDGLGRVDAAGDEGGEPPDRHP